MEFLTEKKLGEVLRDLYPNQVIIPQYKYNNKKYDYGVIFDSEDGLNLMPEEAQDISFENKVVLLVEFNGHYHYTQNHMAALEPQGLMWILQDITRANDNTNYCLLSLPYWIQLDSKMTELLFSSKKDYSGGYPHGFINKKIVLPSNYCRAGEERFINELGNIPKEVAYQVVSSLISKTGYPDNFSKIKIAKTASEFLWTHFKNNFSELETQIDDIILKLNPYKEDGLDEEDELGMAYELGLNDNEEPYIESEAAKAARTLNVNKKIYANYKGKHDFEAFCKNLEKFYEFTLEAYTGDGGQYTREEGYGMWVGYIKSKKEASLYFTAVDQFSAYT